MTDRKLRIAWMYPDTLYLHGERGNILALERFAIMLGLDPVVDRVEFETEDFDPMEYDILFYGAGEITSFPTVMGHIFTYKRSLAEYIASGKTLLATGTTTAMFGQKITRMPANGRKDGEWETMDGLCMIPATAIEREYVVGNDEWIYAEFNDVGMELIGSQIMMTDLTFNECEGYRRFGSLYYGHGNNGNDGMEGVVHGNSIFTNMLGPVLINNPWLTVEIIRAVAKVKNVQINPNDPDYELELKSFERKKKFIVAKDQKF